MRIRCCAEQEDRWRAGRGFRIKKRLKKRIGVLLVQKQPVTLKLVENDEIRWLLAQRRQRERASKAANESCGLQSLDLPLGSAKHCQIEHRAHRLAEFRRQRFTKPLPQMRRRSSQFSLCVLDSPIP